MISMDKKYKRQDGVEVLVKFTDGPASCPVGVITCGVFIGYNNNMMPVGMDVHSAIYCAMRLVEVSPYDDFKIDEPCYFRDAYDRGWVKGYFAGVHHNGLAKRWMSGCTSWSAYDSDDFQTWQQCRRPTTEELAT